MRVGEMTSGDRLRLLGVRRVLCGETDVQADLAGMEQLGIDAASQAGVLI